MKSLDFRKAARTAVEAALDKHADHVVVLDVRKESDVADYVVIAGADSTVQMKAIRSSVVNALDDEGLSPLHQEGQAAGRWIVLDFGGLIIHILLQDARHFYRLESLWEKAKIVRWNLK